MNCKQYYTNRTNTAVLDERRKHHRSIATYLLTYLQKSTDILRRVLHPAERRNHNPSPQKIEKALIIRLPCFGHPSSESSKHPPRIFQVDFLHFANHD